MRVMYDVDQGKACLLRFACVLKLQHLRKYSTIQYKNSLCYQNCQFMPGQMKGHDAQPATCEQESCCTVASSECTPSLPMIDGTSCLEKQQCQGGSVFLPVRLSIMKAACVTRLQGLNPSRDKISFFSTMTRQALGPTQPPMQCVPQVKQLGHEDDQLSLSSPEVKNGKYTVTEELWE
ncbi:uncharacterized protein LOC117282149 [Cryptotermes secundus]|uniref:uncharacterized protein LOC117282149 n=1 Tax=Cryptotermes secundus TaxID=105785 RepID=UPI001454BB5A|nr:uncharacterized protein LOC117282149 [Cryptotermes secundus]